MSSLTIMDLRPSLDALNVMLLEVITPRKCLQLSAMLPAEQTEMMHRPLEICESRSQRQEHHNVTFHFVILSP